MDFNEFSKIFLKKEVKEYPNQVPKLPKVSVLISTYQHKHYIEKCLLSILNQKTDFTFEIIIGDDDSTDGTREICISFAKKFPNRIRLFLHSRKNNIPINHKPSANFNVIYNFFKTKGKFIAICDGDDYWTDTNKLKNQVDFLESNISYSCSFHDVYIKNNSGKKLFSLQQETSAKQSVNLSDFLKSDWLIPTSSFVFRKNTLSISIFFTQTRYLDFLIFATVLLKGEAYYINRPMGFYTKTNPNSITNTKGLFDPLKIKTNMVRYLIYLSQNANVKQKKVIFKRIDKELLKINHYSDQYENSRLIRLVNRFLKFLKK